jgi:hypothetical protein
MLSPRERADEKKGERFRPGGAASGRKERVMSARLVTADRKTPAEAVTP